MSESQSPIPFSSVFDNNNDSLFENGSPGSKRCPTFKEYADKIKQLQQENFQLRVRIYLGEQKSGIKTSSSDLSLFFPPNQQPQLQQFLLSQQQSSQSNTSVHSTTASSETLRLQKEQLSMRVSELENKIHSYEILLKEKQKENAKLMEKNQDLHMQMEQVQTEVALAKIELEQKDIPATLKMSANEDEMERGARIAFGQYYDFEEMNADLQLKLADHIEKIKSLEAKLAENSEKLNSVETLSEGRKQQIDILAKEKDDLLRKMTDFSFTFKGLGTQINDLTEENKILKSKTEEYKRINEELRKQYVPEVLKNTTRDSASISAKAITSLKQDNRILAERLQVSEAALTRLHQEHAKLVGELKSLRNSHPHEPFAIPEKLNNFGEVRPSESNSPDLGIDSGHDHDGAVNSDDSNGKEIKAENRTLRKANRELALKLRQSRQALDATLEKLHSTMKQKEQVEKTVCRQLHKTHTILRNAKKNLEKSASTPCQENIVP